MSYSLGIIGCGVMGQSFLSAIQKCRINNKPEEISQLPNKFYTTNHNLESASGVEKVLAENITKLTGDSSEKIENYGFDGYECSTLEDNIKAIANSDVILFSVKPYQMEEVLTQISKDENIDLSNKVFISLVAGWTIDSIRSILNNQEMIVSRIMTNTPAKFGEGAVVISHTGAVDKLAQWTSKLNFAIGQLGLLVELPESKMDAATALVGSGPAFVLNFLEGMVDAGIKMGIPYKESYMLALKTVEGTAKMGQLTDFTHPSVLKHQVCTPGGTTIAGLVEMDNKGVKAGVVSGIVEAARVASELGKKK
ncbi:hypothetical protein ACO0SA_004672 [Hanseniaspora valbyensis]